MNTLETGIGLLALNCLALFLLRRKPPTTLPAPAPQPEIAWRAHNPHIYTVRRTDAGHERAEELRNAMLDPANHAKVGAALRSPDTGIEWNDGKIEWGKEETCSDYQQEQT